MSDPATRPAICLNMIVRNEAHIVTELLDAVAPYISSWVIVDTGSDDGTQDVIRRDMARLGIPGELHERPWRNFGYNRTEAFALARGRGDYIWVMDADDTIVGALDLTGLDADIYFLHYRCAADNYFREQLFRDGVSVQWVGVTHEYATWDSDSYVEARLEGEYYVEGRHLAAGSLASQTNARDRDLLLEEVKRNPEDTRSVFYLAQSYFALGDYVNARKWYARRIEMGGWEEEAYLAKYQFAESMARLGEPWPDVQDAYVQAWEFRPTRAEALYDIARRYRADGRYQMGYLFAKRAAEVPFPEDDVLYVRTDVYGWRAVDEQAVCASWIDKHAEAFALCRKLLAHDDIPDPDRQRIARNRDVSARTMIEAASAYPDEALLTSLRHPVTDPDGEVVVSLIAGPDRAATEHTLNSFLHCCADIDRIGRFLIVDAGMSAQDGATLADRYRFLEFAYGARLGQIRTQVDARFWLHLGQGWRFFAPENFITRLTAVLDAEAEVFQVGINFADAVQLIGATAAEDAVRRAPGSGRYVLTEEVAHGPAMFDTTRLDRVGGVQPIAELGRRAAAAGLRTASLDEVLCIQHG